MVSATNTQGMKRTQPVPPRPGSDRGPVYTRWLTPRKHRVIAMSSNWSDFGIDLPDALRTAIEAVEAWQESFGHFEPASELAVNPVQWERHLDGFLDRLTGNQYPFFHPHYVGQMLKPPHPVAVVGYVATMLINPNNHALDGGPATAAMEKEAVSRLATMFGFEGHLGHLTSSGTIANLEALWVGREERPGAAVAVSRDAHYTHSRMSRVLGVECIEVEVDDAGRMDLDHLKTVLQTHEVGTVVATLGTTGLGAIDPLADIIPLARASGARVHVDAAYGGFFALVADDSDDGIASRHFAAISDADSVVVDPHKHGLQPYGCGAVLFADPAVGTHYQHDSPYTYFSSDELHLGEISLECSRAGASAAAFWLTTEVFPLTREGLGRVLRPGLRAARRMHERLEASDSLRSAQVPELDIVGYLTRATDVATVDADSAVIFDNLARCNRADQWHVATYSMSMNDLERRGIALTGHQSRARILRSVLMKPEHEAVVDEFVEVLESQVASTVGL